MITKKAIIIFITVPVIFFFCGFIFSRFQKDNRDFVMDLVKQEPLSANGIIRMPAVLEELKSEAAVFIDSKGQKHELPITSLSLPVQYWAALDNDLDVPISKDSFVQGAKIILTLGVDISTGEIKTVWLELDKSRS